MTKNKRVKFITGSQASITPKKTRKINKPKKKYQITKNTKKNPNVLSGTNNLKSSKRRKKNNAKRKQRIQERVEANRKKANTKKEATSKINWKKDPELKKIIEHKGADYFEALEYIDGDYIPEEIVKEVLEEKYSEDETFAESFEFYYLTRSI